MYNFFRHLKSTLYKQNHFAIIFSLLCAGIGGSTIYLILSGCRKTEMMSFNVAGPLNNPLNALWGGIPGVLLALLAMRKIKPAELAMALYPVSLGIILFFFRVNIISTIIFTTIMALTVFRVCLVFPDFKFPKLPERFWQLGLILLTAAFIIQGVFIHIQAWQRQFMLFPDWGLFTEIAHNTLQGNYFHTYWHGDVSFMGDHFEPGFFAVFIPIIWLFPSPYTTIILGALLLWGSALLIYKFSRTRKLPPAWSFILALIFLLFPATSNMFLSLFYGFHPDYLFIPVFILFAIAYEKKKYRLALLIFLYSLTIKETLGAFWFGWGICQIISGKRKWGVWYAIIGLLYFLLCMKGIIPYFQQSRYKYLSDYGPLGNGLIDIALSPFLRPEVFWKTIFSIKNLEFVLLLIVPVFMLAFNRFVLIFSGSIILIFLFLRGNPEAVNLNFWYQTENMVLLNVAAVLGLAAVFSKGHNKAVSINNEFKTFPTIWLRIITSWAGRPIKRRKLAKSLLAGTLIASGFSHYFYARSFYGCYSYENILNKPDCSSVTNEIKSIIPAGDNVNADARCGSHLIIRNRVWDLNKKKQDWVLYDLGDSLRVPFKFHLDMLQRRDYGLIWMKFYKGHQYYIFKRGAETRFTSPLREIPEQEWMALPGAVKLHPDQAENFAVKVQAGRTDNYIQLYCRIKVKRRFHKQCDVLISARDGVQRFNWKIPFGYGICPVQLARPHEVFSLRLNLPPNWKRLESVNITLVPRKE